MLPALLIAAAVGAVLALTAGDEDGGILETVLALPVSRRSVITERGLAVVLYPVALGLVVELVLTVSGAIVHLGLPPAHLSAAYRRGIGRSATTRCSTARTWGDCCCSWRSA